MAVTLSVAIPNETYALFMKLKKLKGFRNQPDTLEWIIGEIARKEGLD